MTKQINVKFNCLSQGFSNGALGPAWEPRAETVTK